MLVIRRLFGTGTNCIAPSGLPLLLCLSPGLAPWAFLSRPCGASFATETKLYKRPATTPERDLRADLAPRAYPYRPRGPGLEMARMAPGSFRSTPPLGAAH